MAKAAPAPEVDRRTDPHEWFAAILRLRFDEVIQHLDPAIDLSTVKAVHDLRVAIRRLRSLIRDFAGIADVGRFKRIVKTLKHLADQLGDVRDKDVYIRSSNKNGL